jgi:hypothetical protein
MGVFIENSQFGGHASPMLIAYSPGGSKSTSHSPSTHCGAYIGGLLPGT